MRAEGSAPPPPAAEAPEAAAPRRDRSRRVIAGVLLGLIVVVGLFLRLRNNDYGLPHVYNFDEAQHFVSHSVNVFGGEVDPRYYQNPSGYTYLIFLALKLWYGIFGFHLHYGTVAQQFFVDPTPIWKFTRTFTALIAMAGVLATFFMARRWWGVRVALVAAALLTFAFLPVTYSRIAVTDVATFFPVAVALYASFRVLEDGRLRWYVLAGAAVGLATGFKYTAGLVLFPLLIAFVVRFARDRGTPLWKRRDLLWGAASAIVAVLVFAATTPYFFVHWSDAISQLREQAVAAGKIEKLGQAQEGGFSYYFHTLGWGFGWARSRCRGPGSRDPAAARPRARPDAPELPGRALRLHERADALLRALAADDVPGARAVRGDRRGARVHLDGGPPARAALRGPPLGLGGAGRARGCAHRADPHPARRRRLAHLAGPRPRRHAPDRPRLARVALPAEPPHRDRARRRDRLLPAPAGAAQRRGRQFVQGFVRDLRRQQKIDAPLGADTTYAATLSPSNIDAYRSAGFCLVMTNSLTRGRAENAQVPNALAYYRRLERESDHIYHVSPFKPGRKPVPLHFDFSYNYYPTAYERPGGVVDVYRLRNCTQKTGRVVEFPYGNSGLQKGVGTAYAPSGATAGSGDPTPASP